MIWRAVAGSGVSTMALVAAQAAAQAPAAFLPGALPAARVAQSSAASQITAPGSAPATDARPPASITGPAPTTASSATPAPQNATATPPADAAQGEAGGAASDIVVTGIRQSLERAAEVKRQSIQVVDSIVAQDIGKLPDPTTAAALQRVPGVQVSVNRNNELSGVLIRGLPDVLTTVNGRQVFTAAGANNGNGDQNGGRAFDLQDIPAEALARVDVFKSQTPDLIEGGLAGIVDLELNKPFSFRKPTAVLSARTNYGLRDKRFGPQLGLLLTDRWSTGIGDIGVLADGTYARQGYTRASTILVDRRSSFATPYNTPGLLLPNLIQSFPETGYVERKQVNATVQWQPTPSLQASIEGFYTSFRDRGAHEGANAQPNTATGTLTGAASLSNVVVGNQCFTTRATTGTGANGINGSGQNPAVVVNPTTGAQTLQANTIQQLCQPTSATFNNIALNQTDQARDDRQNNKQIAGSLRYDQGGWKGDVDVAYQSSRDDSKIIVADVGQRLSTLAVVFDDDGSSSYITPNNALVSPDNLILRNSLQQNYLLATGNLFQAKADGERDFDAGLLKNIRVGIRYGRQTGDFQSVMLNTPVPLAGKAATTATSPNFGTNEASLLRFSQSGLPGSFLALSPIAPDLNGGARFLVPSADFLLNDASLDQLRQIFLLPSGRPAYDPTRQFDVAERTVSGYLQTNYEVAIGGNLRLDGIVGVRLTSARRNFTGFQLVNSVVTPVQSQRSDFDALPAATARLRVGDNLQFRAGYEKTLRRPDFTQLNPSPTLNTSANPLVQSSATVGNPDLQEQKADSYDATAEFYYHGGYIALAGYYRNITNRVINSLATETFNNIPYTTSRPRNLGQARLFGIEVSGQYFFDFLPGALSGLGTQNSFTLSNSKIEGTDPLAGLPLQGVSKYNFTTGLLYEKHGISARLVYTFRSRYFAADLSGNTTVRPIDPTTASIGSVTTPSTTFTPVPRLVSYVRPAGRLDFNIGVDATNAIRFDIGGTNIMRNRTQSYIGEGGYSHINLQTQYDETTYSIGVRVRY